MTSRTVKGVILFMAPTYAVFAALVYLSHVVLKAPVGWPTYGLAIGIVVLSAMVALSAETKKGQREAAKDEHEKC